MARSGVNRFVKKLNLDLLAQIVFHDCFWNASMIYSSIHGLM